MSSLIIKEIQLVLRELAAEDIIIPYLCDRYQRFTTPELSRLTRGKPYTGEFRGYGSDKFVRDGEILIFEIEYKKHSKLCCWLTMGPAADVEKRSNLYRIAKTSGLYTKGKSEPSPIFQRIASTYDLIDENIILVAEKGALNIKEFKEIFRKRILHYLDTKVRNIENVIRESLK